MNSTLKNISTSRKNQSAVALIQRFIAIVWVRLQALGTLSSFHTMILSPIVQEVAEIVTDLPTMQVIVERLFSALRIAKSDFRA